MVREKWQYLLSGHYSGSQADTIGIAMRRALLGEIEGTCITRVKFESEKIPHEYSTVGGIQESLHNFNEFERNCIESNIYMELVRVYLCRVLDM
ncbi:hypothetical protein Leryth_026763 [Lithospermum erythrorhizon]|nr:hypothetical protein Leryth_026763 [Lithospermum erythrorhizon]